MSFDALRTSTKCLVPGARNFVRSATYSASAGTARWNEMAGSGHNRTQPLLIHSGYSAVAVGQEPSPTGGACPAGGRATVEFYSRRNDSVTDRRTVIRVLAAGIIAVPLAARAQTATTVRRMGVLVGGAPPT